MTPRIGMVPRAITLVPLAALSAVWTVNIARTPAADMSSVAGPAATTPQSSAASSSAPPALPSLPGSALVVPPDTQAPASVWGDAKPAAGNAVVAAGAMSAQAIPAVALAAYQRAATVIDTADRACHLDWTLLAAIGRIESDHGTHGGSRLSSAGLASPSIVGPALTGLGGTMLVKDTDAGGLDGDTRYDHAVGPMQFLPSTWSVVGVDADGDGQRDPQDIDDAALAAGVYLCSGTDDLSTDAGRRGRAAALQPLGVLRQHSAGRRGRLPVRHRPGHRLRHRAGRSRRDPRDVDRSRGGGRAGGTARRRRQAPPAPSTPRDLLPHRLGDAPVARWRPRPCEPAGASRRPAHAASRRRHDRPGRGHAGAAPHAVHAGGRQGLPDRDEDGRGGGGRGGPRAGDRRLCREVHRQDPRGRHGAGRGVRRDARRHVPVPRDGPRHRPVDRPLDRPVDRALHRPVDRPEPQPERRHRHRLVRVEHGDGSRPEHRAERVCERGLTKVSPFAAR